MNRLLEGVHRFRREAAARYRELFGRLAREGQHPHALVVTCSDARVMASLFTQSRPGDLFIVKNVGNIVPPASDPAADSVAAAIEYAVNVLAVPDILVCGHTQCGAMQALLQGVPAEPAMPHLVRWLDLFEPVRIAVARRCTPGTDLAARVDVAAEENVRMSLGNLHRFPAVADGVAAGRLRLHGWLFRIATTEVLAFDPRRDQFLPLPESAGDGGAE